MRVGMLDRYILRRFFQYFLFALLASAVIFITVDFTEFLDKFIDAKISWGVVARYYYLYIPYIIYLTLPVSVLLATLFSIGGFVYRNEFAAMQAAGYSLWRVLGLFLLVAIPLSAMALVFGETIVPAANHERKEIYRGRIKKGTSATSSRQGRLYMQVGPSEYLKMESYDPQGRTGERINLQAYNGEQLRKRVDADLIRYTGEGWMMYNAQIRTFVDSKVTVDKQDSLFRRDFGVTPDDLARVNIEPEEMNYTDLHNMVRRLQTTGIRAGKWIVDLAFKISQPFAAAIIVLFGVPFAAFRRRGGLVLGFGLSLLVCFVYFGFIQVGKIMGYNGTIPPIIAAWAGNVVFGLLGIYLVFRVPK